MNSRLDPLLTLSIAVHSGPGFYALLLGSGVSRPAGIPTGWDIIVDLCRRLAILHGEDGDGNPVEWYARRHGKEPRYDHLLKAVASLPSERNQLLRSYFEPTAEEAEQGLKVPTAGHHAIAELVECGYVRVILTTNFDRLLERAIEQKGITPVVICNAADAAGALPIVHNRVTLIKVNGDYLDIRTNNTTAELRKVPTILENLILRVLDDFGVIVCGW